MKKHIIWLATGHTFWDWMEGNETLHRERKGEVNATNLEEAFMMSQGGMNPEWKNRSCSVSDVIEVDGKFHLVMGIGFKEIPKPFPGYEPK